MIYFVMEACKSRLLGQRPLSCKPLQIPAAGKKKQSTDEYNSQYEWHAEQYTLTTGGC